MGRKLAIYAATFLAVGLLDAIWLGGVATSWYMSGMGHLMAAKPNLVAAAAFYLAYPVGLMLFAVLPSGGVGQAMQKGALFGLFCYGTYDATNLALLKDWPVGLTLIDTAWGMAVSAMGAGAGAWVGRRMARQASG